MFIVIYLIQMIFRKLLTSLPFVGHASLKATTFRMIQKVIGAPRAKLQFVLVVHLQWMCGEKVVMH